MRGVRRLLSEVEVQQAKSIMSFTIGWLEIDGSLVSLHCLRCLAKLRKRVCKLHEEERPKLGAKIA